MAGFFGALFGLLGCGGGEKSEYDQAKVYRGLREQLFSLDPSKIGLAPDAAKPVWGVIMETGYPEAVVTLAAIADGTVSMYFSNGGGMIGLGGKDGPRMAGADLISAANGFVSQFTPVSDFPLPKKGFVKFYLLTRNGVVMADASEVDLGNNRLPLSALFFKAQEVITQARLSESQ